MSMGCAFFSDYQESFSRKTRRLFQANDNISHIILVKTKNYKSSSTGTENDGSRGLRINMTDNSGIRRQKM